MGAGADLEYLRQLLEYWAGEFDWQTQERELNAATQFRAELDGVHIHFVHERARHGHGVPLILTHGWPSTFVELLPLVPFLTDPHAHGIGTLWAPWEPSNAEKGEQYWMRSDGAVLASSGTYSGMTVMLFQDPQL